MNNIISESYNWVRSCFHSNTPQPNQQAPENRLSSSLIKAVLVAGALLSLGGIRVFYPPSTPRPKVLSEHDYDKSRNEVKQAFWKWEREVEAIKNYTRNKEAHRYAFLERACDIITDEEWQNLDYTDIHFFTKERPQWWALFHLKTDCFALDQRLSAKVASELQDVPAIMGFDPHLITMNFGAPNMGISSNNTVSISYEFAFSLNKLLKTYTREEARGVFAHELAHRILKHAENTVLFPKINLIKNLSISIESLSDFKELEDAVISHFKGLPKPGISPSATRLIEDFVQTILGKEEYSESVFEKKVKEKMLELQNELPRKFSDLEKHQEIEADSLTARSSPLARGLLSFLSNLEKRDPASCKDSDDHPPCRDRIRHLTEALCAQHPEENRDLCSVPENRTPLIRAKIISLT